MKKKKLRLLSSLLLVVMMLHLFSGMVDVFASGEDDEVSQTSSAETEAVSTEETATASEDNLLLTEPVTEPEIDALLEQDLFSEAAEEIGDAEPSGSEQPQLAFDQSRSCGGVLVRVQAEENAFPADAVLSVRLVSGRELSPVLDAVEAEGGNGSGSVGSYTFDITIRNAEGEELQPAPGSFVQVSFSMEEVAMQNYATNIYHVTEQDGELSAEALPVETEGDTATVVTDGFSFYTVEFTFGDLQYVMQGGDEIRLSELLAQLGLAGTIQSWSVSSPALFNVYLGDENGIIYGYEPINDEESLIVPTNAGTIPWLLSLQPFSTEEWLRVVIDGVEYEIVVTDDDTQNTVPAGYSGTISTRLDDEVAVTADAYYQDAIENYNEGAGKSPTMPSIVRQSQSTDSIYDFAAGLPLSTIFIDETMLGGDKGTYSLENQELNAVITYDPDTNIVSYDPRNAGGHLQNGTVNTLSGHLFSFTFPDAAILPDGTKASVKIIYSNAQIFTDERLKAMEKVAKEHLKVAETQEEIDAANQELAASYYAGQVDLAQGSVVRHSGGDVRKLTQTSEGGFTSAQVEAAADAMASRINQYSTQSGLSGITTSVTNGPSLGKSIDVTYQVIDNKGNPVDGTFIFAFVGINLERDPYAITNHNSGKGLWWVQDTYPATHFLNEQVAVTNSSIASDYIYVRANNSKYEEDGNDRTLGFYPQIVEAVENNVTKTKIIANAYRGRQGTDGFYSSGFVTLARSGFTITAYGHSWMNNGNIGAGNMNTQAYGARRIWYRYTSSTGPNGNIQTTSEGNNGGTLDDTSDPRIDPVTHQTVSPKSNVLDPNTYVVPEGKTVTYTMKPDDQYVIAKLQYRSTNGNMVEVKNGDQPLYTMLVGESVTFTDQAGRSCKVTAQANGVFTLEVPYAQHDEEFHVEWERSVAQVTVKKVTEEPTSESFDFKIKAKKHEDVVTYDPVKIGQIWWDKDAEVYKTWYVDGVTCDNNDADLAAIVANALLEHRIEISGGEYLWKTDKKLSDLGITSPYNDAEYLLVKFMNAASANQGDTLNKALNEGYNTTYGQEIIEFLHPQSKATPTVTYWHFGKGEGQAEDPGEYSFSLSNGGEQKFDIPQKYEYVVYEQTPIGWELVSVDGVLGASCAAGLLIEEQDPEHPTAGIGTTPVHTFRNRKLPSLTVQKETAYNTAGSFPFTVKFTQKAVEAQGFNVTVTASVTYVDEVKQVEYTLSNSGAAFAVDGITVPAGNSKYGTTAGLDAVFDKLLALTSASADDDKAICLGTNNGTVSTEETTSLAAWVVTQSEAGTQTYTFSLASDAVAAQPYVLSATPSGVTYNETDKSYSFTLSNGGSIVFSNLPYDVEYVVTESPSVIWEQKDATNDSGSLTADTTATFVNELKLSPPTGLFSDPKPWILMILLAAGAATLFLLRRRQLRED